MNDPETPVASASEPAPAASAPEPAPSAAVPAIDARALTKVFQGKPAVDQLTLQVARGRFFGFLGPNGAGKSTTIKMLTGLLRPTSGQAFVEGLDLAKDRLAIKQRIGVLPEELPLYERLTGEEYLLFAGRMYGLSAEETRKRTDELLAFLSLEEDRGRLILDYSQGMRKKVALAAALIHNPRVLFLDEPLNGIDPVSGRVVTDLLRRLAQKGVTMFFTSHVLDVVERLCDEVAIIDRGRIVAQGTLDEIRRQREVGLDASLEDVFIKLVAADVKREDLSWID
ncbi:MAG TPA: ABC transporter ATP-binding protein [Vicinamibacteria bacterium]|nr:ABC transporter ATP-binding protein [Vicinamibacteria bacterium]